MAIDAWLPVGYVVPTGDKIRVALHEGPDWQIFLVMGGGRVLIAQASIAQRWESSSLLDSDGMQRFLFSNRHLAALSSASHWVLAPVYACESPQSKAEAMDFANALRASRKLDVEDSLHDAIYVERLGRLLPTFSLTPRWPDDLVLGTWLSGGVPVSANSTRRLGALTSWLGPKHLQDVLAEAGFTSNAEHGPGTKGGQRNGADEGQAEQKSDASPLAKAPGTGFALIGRPELERFFNEHVVDIVENEARYKALGIDFPSAVILHGPPGCGKTFAAERLVDYLGWPSYQIEASSVASPYIHETSKKVAEVFEKAMQNAPSVLIIDEMEAFLADRESGAGSSHHRVEEVAEFLRRIPEAVQNHVLIIAMTNRIEMIDAAILRRGRFDHIVEVDMASQEEVAALLKKLIAELPTTGTIDVGMAAERLDGRPLSDVTFVVREAARLAARSGKSTLDQDSLIKALEASDVRGEAPTHRPIGFV